MVRTSPARFVAGGAVMMMVLSSCRAVFGIEDKYYAEDGEGGSAGAGGAATVAATTGGETCGAALESDPENCGACGHGCLGGECREGACMPTVFLAGVAAQSLANDYDRIYFADYDTFGVHSIRKDQTDPQTLFTADYEHRPAQIALAGQTLYFAVHNYFDPASYGPGWLARVQTDGSGYQELAEIPAGPWAMATDGADAFFTARWGDPTLGSFPLSNGPVSTLIPFEGAYPEIFGIEPWGEDIYFAAWAAGTISRVPKQGGAVEVLRTGEPSIALVGSGTELFWSANGAIWRAPLPLLEPKVMVAPVQARVLAIAGDQIHFASDHLWGRVNVDGTGMTVLADGLALTECFTVDDEAVYLSDKIGNVIYRVAR
jgi:hypothetical protein